MVSPVCCKEESTEIWKTVKDQPMPWTRFLLTVLGRYPDILEEDKPATDCLVWREARMVEGSTDRIGEWE